MYAAYLRVIPVVQRMRNKLSVIFLNVYGQSL